MYRAAFDLTHPKALGAYYTPSTIAGILANWVVQTGSERLLEPSVGGGALMAAAIARAGEIGGSQCGLRFLACDINPAAIQTITRTLPPGSTARAVDFLQLDVASTGLFEGIIANPPFTRNHALPAERRAILRKRFGVSGAAGLWVHFLFHAVEFLAPGGRLAAVVPAAALFSRYGRAALERIAARFKSIELHGIVDKPLWVNGAEERGAIVLAGGFGLGSSTLPAVTPLSGHSRSCPRSDKADRVFDQLSERCMKLGAIAKIRIGAVTGCNSVFLLSESHRIAAGISRDDVLPIVSRARQVPGLLTTSQDLLSFGEGGERTWLLKPRMLGVHGGPVRARLAEISARRRRQTLWFSKREPWWQVETSEQCDAIFTYMNDYSPRLVLTDGHVRSTNTLHELRFADSVSDVQRSACALSMISTFGQLAAERLGRSYGGGVLKFELCEARQLPILPAPNRGLKRAFRDAHAALLRSARNAARDIADEALIAPLLGAGWQKQVAAMAGELQDRRELRQGRHG